MQTYMTEPVETQTARQEGFTLIECVVAMVLALIVFAGIYGLFVMAVRMQMISKDLATANALARGKIEDLRNTALTPGGSLTTDVAGYNDTPSTNFERRWLIATDAVGTKTVTVTTLANNPGILLPPVQITTRIR